MRIKRKVVAFEVKAVTDTPEGPMFEGYAACTKNIDSYGELIAPGAFAADLPKFMDDGFVGGLNHDWDRPIGKPIEAREDAKGLYCKALLLDTEHAKECHAYLKAGVCKKLSIGFTTVGKTYLETGDDVRSYWQSLAYTPTQDDESRARDGAVRLDRVRLFEFSPVMRPANTLCDITNVKSGQRAGLTFEDHLLSALATVEEIAERSRQLAVKRLEAGRALPPERVAVLRKMREVLDAILKTKGVVPAVDAGEIARIEAELLAMEADLGL